MIRVRCPSCEQLLGIPEGTAGNTTTCPQCAHRFQVSAADAVKKPRPQPARVNARPQDARLRLPAPPPKVASKVERPAPIPPPHSATLSSLPHSVAPHRRRLDWMIATAVVLVAGGAFATYRVMSQSSDKPANVVPNVANVPQQVLLPKVVNAPQQGPLPPVAKQRPESVLVRADLFVIMRDKDVNKIAGNNVEFILLSELSEPDVAEIRRASREYFDLTVKNRSVWEGLTAGDIADFQRRENEGIQIRRKQAQIGSKIDSLLSKSHQVVKTDKDGSLEASLKTGEYLLRTDTVTYRSEYFIYKQFIWIQKVTVSSPMPKIVLDYRYDQDVDVQNEIDKFYWSLDERLK